MVEIFSRAFENLVGRTEGPMKLRLIFQPLMACLLAAKAGKRDAREGRAPYFWAIVSDADHRRFLLREGWKNIAKVFVASVVLDAVYQLIQLHTVYAGEAIVVGILLALVPYLLVRGLVTRLSGGRKRPS